MPFLLDDSTAPRSARTLAEMQDRVRGDLSLRDSDRVTDDDLVEWLNEASDVVARETKWYRTSETMGTTSGTKEYALPIPTAGRCLQIEEIRYGTTQLLPVTLQQLLDLDWSYREAGSGTPSYYYVRGSSGFGLHVTPDTTSATNLLVVFVGKPPRVTAPSETFYVPHALEDGLIIYAKKLASEKDVYGEGARRASLYEAQWQAFLQAARKQVSRAAERSRPVMGSDAVSGGYPRRRGPASVLIT